MNIAKIKQKSEALLKFQKYFAKEIENLWKSK